MKVLTVGSLFSGIGGFDLGLERSGMEIQWQVEIDDFCNKVLEKHWPNIRRYRDVKEVHGSSYYREEERSKNEQSKTVDKEEINNSQCLEQVNVIVGGFPCQPFSNAGKRKGKEDYRFLWKEMFRIISEIKPSWVIGENVTGIINMELDNCLFDLESIGYETQTFIIPACAIGAYHRRDRVWIIANSNSKRFLVCNDNSRSSEKKYRDRWEGLFSTFSESDIEGTNWGIESRILRVVDGVSDRMDRIKSLGNAVIPQITEIFGRVIISIEQENK